MNLCYADYVVQIQCSRSLIFLTYSVPYRSLVFTMMHVSLALFIASHVFCVCLFLMLYVYQDGGYI